MRILESRAKREKKTLLIELLDIIAADGKIDEKEETLFIETGRKLGFSDKEILKIIKNPSKVKLLIPKKEETKIEHLGIIMSMVGIDGDVSSEEYAMCKAIALNYDFDPNVVDIVLSDLVKQMKLTVDGEEVI